MYIHHILLPLLPVLLPLIHAAPTATSAPLPCASVSLDWQTFELDSFTAAPGTSGASSVDFSIIDGGNSNANTIATCSRTLPAGQSPFDPNHFYPCQADSSTGVGIEFKYTNTTLSLMQGCTVNGASKTAAGSGKITNFCGVSSDGTRCVASPSPLDVFPTVS